MNAALGEIEAKASSVQIPTSHGDGGASFALQALDAEHDEVLQEEDLEGVVDDEPPGGGAAGEAREIEGTGARDSIGKLTGPLAYGVLDTISQLDIEVRKLNMNAANASSYMHKIDSDLQQCIPATNYATRNVDAILAQLKNMQDSLALLHDKTHRQEKRLDYAMDHVAAFEVMDGAKDTSPQPSMKPVRAMLESSSPPHGSGAPVDAEAIRELGEASNAQADAISAQATTISEIKTSFETKHQALASRTSATEENVRSLAKKIDTLLVTEAHVRSLSK